MSTPGKPDWVCCISKPREDEKHTTWCGRRSQVFEFVLVGLDHAACLGESRLQPCDDCVRAACTELQRLAFAAEPPAPIDTAPALRDRLAALSRIVRRALSSHQLEKLEDARPYLDDADQPTVTGVTVARPQIDLDGVIDRDGLVTYIGKATHSNGSKYRCLARVGDALCVVEVDIKAASAETDGRWEAVPGEMGMRRWVGEGEPP